MRIKVPEGMLKAAWEQAVIDGCAPYCEECIDGGPNHPIDSDGDCCRHGEYSLSKGKTVFGKSLEAALLWLSENPIVPTEEQIAELDKRHGVGTYVIRMGDGFKHDLAEWQRRMFLAPEPEVPEEIKELLETCAVDAKMGYASDHSDLVLEAYRRGQRSKA